MEGLKSKENADAGIVVRHIQMIATIGPLCVYWVLRTGAWRQIQFRGRKSLEGASEDGP